MHEPFHRFHDRGLGPRIDGAGGLVEDEDRGILQEGAGERDALALAAGETHAALADLGLVALRQVDDKGVRVGGLRRSHNLRHAGVGTRVANVFGDAGRQEHGLLEDDGELVAEVAEPVVTQINPVE